MICEANESGGHNTVYLHNNISARLTLLFHESMPLHGSKVIEKSKEKKWFDRLILYVAPVVRLHTYFNNILHN